MNLKDYFWKKVRITRKNGKVYAGFINEYIEADDNYSGIESIVMHVLKPNHLEEFYEEDIRSIEIIE